MISNFFPGTTSATIASKKRFVCAGIIAALLIITTGKDHTALAGRNYTQAQSSTPESPEELAAGKKIYEGKCLSCHGVTGEGDGPAADLMEPRPRNLATAHYILRTTPWMSLPTDSDLFNVITDGVEATSMPAWRRLSDRERWQVTHYIKTFSERFKKEPPPAPINIGSEVSPTPTAVEEGKELFKKAKCHLCHGIDGRADGPITVTLKTEWGISPAARDLTKGGIFKAGTTLKDIYVTITTGFNGTPMGPYADILSDEDRWKLAAYVKSLSSASGVGKKVVISSRLIEEEITMDADAPIWQEIEPVELPLAGQIMVTSRQFTPTIDAATVRTLYNGKEIAFLLEWNDTTNIQDEDFRDAIAVQFPIKIPESSQKPHLAMGDGKGKVNIWRWKALWDEEADDPALLNTAEPYIATAVDDMNSKGYTSLTTQPAENQHVTGQGSWSNGKWRVLIKRKVSTGDANDIQFKGGRLIPMALAIWDGSNKDVGAGKSISFWYYLVLEQPTPISPYLYTFVSIIMGVSIELWFVGRLRRKPPFNT